MFWKTRVWGVGCLAILPIAVLGCSSDGQCLAACVSESRLELDSPISEPGDYSLRFGSLSCQLELPAVSVPCGSGGDRLVMEDFAVSGVVLEGAPPAKLTVEVEKDGDEILSRQLDPTSVGGGTTCGQQCESANFELSVPEALVREPVERCERDRIEGTYEVVAERIGGECPSFRSDSMVEFVEGRPVAMDECGSSVDHWSAEDCELEATSTCETSSLDATWRYELTDVAGDGARLLGSGRVEMRAPLSCQGTFLLDLRRRN